MTTTMMILKIMVSEERKASGSATAALALCVCFLRRGNQKSKQIYAYTVRVLGDCCSNLEVLVIGISIMNY